MRTPVVGRLLRLALGLPLTLLLVTAITFVLLRLAPGDPAAALGAGSNLDGDAAQAWRRLQGLSEPWPVHYLNWLGRSLRLDFGASWVGGQAVRDIILQAMPKTAALTASALLVVYGLAVPLGVLAAIHDRSLALRILRPLAFGAYAVPSFWAALMLLVWASAGGSLPLRGLHSADADDLELFPWLIDSLWHLLLPVLCLSYAPLVRTIRFQQAASREILDAPHIQAARARGLEGAVLVRRHVVRNSLVPLVTLLTLDLPWIVGGSVVIERIFSIHGMGMVAFQAVLQRDLPVLLGVVTVVCVSSVAALAAGDVLLRWLNPAQRAAPAAGSWGEREYRRWP